MSTISSMKPRPAASGSVGAMHGKFGNLTDKFGSFSVVSKVQPPRYRSCTPKVGAASDEVDAIVGSGCCQSRRLIDEAACRNVKAISDEVNRSFDEEAAENATPPAMESADPSKRPLSGRRRQRRKRQPLCAAVPGSFGVVRWSGSLGVPSTVRLP